MINAIDLRMLRNGEFLQFVTNFSDLVGSNNPVLLNVVDQHTALKAKVMEIEPLFKQERASVITQQLILLDERRDNAINGISLVIDGYVYHFDAAIANAANLLQNDLKLFGSGIAKQNYQAETASVNGIISDWETKPELTAALATLGITTWAAELKTANQLFNQKYLERTQEYGAANPDTLKAKRDETMVVYYEMRKFLDAYSVIQNTPAYQKAISELNALIDQYNGLLNGRQKEVTPAPTPAAN